MATPAFEISGLKELNENLSKLAFAVEKKLIRKALKKGGQILKVEMERKAWRSPGGPSHPDVGHLADHIVMKVSITKKRGAVVKVGPDKDHWWGGFQEWGTPHTPADSFMRATLDTKAQKVISVVAADLGQGVEKEAAKLGAKQRIKR